MTSVDTARDVAVLWTLDFDAELPCESRHEGYNAPDCSRKATHMANTCARSNFLICKALSKHFWEWQHFNCQNCGQRASNCWSIRPI